MSKTIFYLAVLTGLLMVLAYHTGAQGLLTQGVLPTAIGVGNTFSGRNQQGNFAAYPSGS